MSVRTQSDHALWEFFDVVRGSIPNTDAVAFLVGLLLLQKVGRETGDSDSLLSGPNPAESIRRLASNPPEHAAFALEALRIKEHTRTIPDAALVGLFDGPLAVLEQETSDLSLVDRIFQMAQDPRRTATSSTPPDVLQLISALATLDFEERLQTSSALRLLDPACGAGGTLHHLRAHLNKLDPSILIESVGQEVAVQTAGLAAARSLLLGVPNHSFESCDSLVAPKDPIGFDYVVANPPLDGAVSPNVVAAARDSPRFPGSIYKQISSTAFLQLAVDQMKPRSAGGGRAVMISALGPLFRGGAEAQFRKWILESDLVEGLVKLPPQLFLHTRIPTVAWVLSNSKSEERAGYVQLVDATDTWVPSGQRIGSRSGEIPEDGIERILDRYRSAKNGRWAERRAVSDFHFRSSYLEYQQHDPEDAESFVWDEERNPVAEPSLQTEVRIQGKQTDQEFLDLLPTTGRERWISGVSNEDLWYINPKLIADPASADIFNSAPYLMDFAISRYRLGSGLQSPSDNTIFVGLDLGSATSEVPDTNGRSQTRWDAIQLDPLRCDATFLATTLSSGSTTKVSAHGTTPLNQLKVRLPSIKDQLHCVRVQHKIDLHYSGLEEFERTLWDNPHRAGEIADELERVGRESEPSQIVDALPFPIASAFWSYFALRDQSDSAALEQLGHVFEATSSFVATVLLSAAKRSPKLWGEVIPEANEQATTNGLSIERATFGMWNQYLAVLSKRFRALLNGNKDSQQIAYEAFNTSDSTFLQMITNRNIVKILETANTRRNNWKGHGGSRTAAVDAERHSAQAEELEALLKIFGRKWARYPVISPINNTYQDSLFRYQTHLLQGTRTPFGTKEILLSQPINNSRLAVAFIEDQSALELLPLFQLGTSDARETCYFFNRLEDEGVRLVSHHQTGNPEVIEVSPDVRRTIEMIRSAS